MPLPLILTSLSLTLILTASPKFLLPKSLTPIMSSPSPPSSSAAAVTTAAVDLLPSSANVVVLATPSPNTNPNPTTARRGLPPPCWTDEETLALIDCYREKWYSLCRGNLRSADWDSVATAVAARSLHLPSSTPKTSVQCRHKIEKLRKRYRSERQRALNHNPNAPPTSPWIFFSKMEQMENPNPSRYQDSDDDNDDEDEEIEPTFHRRPQIIANGGGGGGGGLKFKIPKAVRTSRAVPIGNPNPHPNPSPISGFSANFNKGVVDEMRTKLEAKRRREEDEEKSGGDAMGEMVRALRMLGDGYMRMEQMKMEMAREMERARMEMELKRTEMILDTQRQLVDTFVNGIVSEKKVKRSSDS